MKTLSSVVAIVVLALLASAQNKESVSLMPANIAAVTSQLKALGSLPAEEWRMHVGDMAHGEATTLDDSTWEVVKANSQAPVGAVWYRSRITVPAALRGYELSEARIWFHFEAHANGPVSEIIYFDGRRVAMGDDLEPIVLFDSAKPGDTVLVAVKLQGPAKSPPGVLGSICGGTGRAFRCFCERQFCRHCRNGDALF